MNRALRFTLLALLAGSLLLPVAGCSIEGDQSGSDSESGATSSCDFSFSGNGSTDLAPTRLPRPATLTWTAEGGYFYLNSHRGDPSDSLHVISRAATGSGYMKAGTHQIGIGAVDDWTICIVLT